MIHPTATLSRAHNDAQLTAPMTIAEALVLMRAAKPDGSIQAQVNVWDHSHTAPGQDPADYQLWDGKRHFVAATLRAAVEMFLIHHDALAAQDPDTAI